MKNCQKIFLSKIAMEECQMSYIVIIITRLLKFNWEHAQNNGQKITAIGPTDTFVHWTHSKHSKTTL